MLAGLLLILLPLVLGYLVPVHDPRLLAWIERGVSLSVYIILGLMGVGLTGLDDLGQQMARMGGQAALLFLIITPLNLAALGWLSQRSRLHGTSETATDMAAPTGTLVALRGSLQLAGVVVLGVMLGLLADAFGSHSLAAHAERLAEWVLYALLALIGCQLRNSGLPLRQILLNRQGLAIASTVAASSLLAGLLVAPLLDLRWNEGLAMAAG
ncbi:MAG: LysO family transporter, partial [Halomonas sp.]|nr:LysO family transporter [Halomonas sp.]